MRLLKQLRKKPYCNDTHFFLVAVLLFLLGFTHFIFFFILLIYLFFIFKKTKLIIPILIVVILIASRVFYQKLIDRIDLGSSTTGYVVEVKDEDSYILFSKGIKVLVTEKNHNNTPGDIITVSLTKSYISPKSYASDFDYSEYLASKGITYKAKGVTKELKLKSFALTTIKYYYMQYLSNHLSKDSYTYVSVMVFGENTLEDNIKEAYSILGISHILAISGLHILFLYKVLSFLLLKLFKYYKKGLPIVLITLFTILIGAPKSALRATLFLVISALNRKGEQSYTKLDILSISCIIMLLINPFSLYSSGFILTYIVSFVLLYSNEIVKSKSKLLGSYKSYYLIYFSTFPIVINITNRISFLSLIFSPILSIVVTILLLPLSYLLAVFPILDFAVKYIFIVLNLYVEGLTANALFLSFPSFSLFTAILYYILFILFILCIKMKKKRVFSLVCFIFYTILLLNLRVVNPFYRITFIDCGQGDSILIEIPFGRGNILIDAYNSYDFLVDIGIKRIDALVLTHSDKDHIGDYEAILQGLKVGMVYYPTYDTKLQNLLVEYNSVALHRGDTFKVSNIDFYTLGPIKSYSDVNSNSLVLKTTILNTSYLFTGDMTIEEEKDLLEANEKELDVDILKVGHHGSTTSSSKEFLDAVRPNYSFISVSANNSYGLPDKDIVRRLNTISTVYMTKDSGNITIYQINTQFHISTYR